MSSKQSPVTVLSAALLVIALVFTQVGWRGDRAVFRTLRANFDKLSQQTAFTSTGDFVSDRELLLMSGEHTISLAQLVMGRSAIVYFEKVGCPACDWLENEMRERNPTWKEGIIVVSATSSVDSMRGAYRMPEASLQQLPGVPTLLVIDSTGLVVHSAVGVKRLLNILHLVNIPAPTVADLMAQKIEPDTTQAPANSSSARGTA